MTHRVGRLLLVPVLAVIGAVPGILLSSATDEWRFLGVALLGGLAGLGLGVASLAYRTSILGSARRIFKGVVCILVEYNVGFGKEITAVTREPNIESLLPSNSAQLADPDTYYRVTKRAALLGAFGLGAIGLLCGWYSRPDDDISQQVAYAFIFVLPAVLEGAVFGWAIGALTVRGRHRPRIVIGLVAGLLIGCGPLLIALGTPVNNARPIGWFLFSLFTTLGVGAGTFASESLPAEPGENG
jgi:hypothetical protein